LFIKNVANTLLRVELQKILGEQHKIVTVYFRKQVKKGGRQAFVVVESKAALATVIDLVNKKTVNGKELEVTSAKKPEEKPSFIARVAALKKLEKFPSVWPAPTYKHVANSDPLKNKGFPSVFVHGEKLAIQPPKTIKKKVAVPSPALYLSKIPKTVNKKQIYEAFKDVKIRRAVLSKNKKRLNYGFIIFKNADERKKAQEAVKDKIVIGENTISVHEATKFAKQTVEVPNEKIKAAPAAPAKKELSVNGIAKKKFTAYRVNLHNRKARLARLVAIKKIKDHKQAVAQGKAQPRLVRQLKPKALVKPEVLKKQQKKSCQKGLESQS